MAASSNPLLSWTTAVPAVAFVAVPLTWGRDLPWPAVAVVAVLLAGAVLAAVHLALFGAFLFLAVSP